MGITAFYCEPGLRGAHEKGGVEGQVGYWRRNYLTPVQRVDSLDELNARFAEFERAEEARRIGMRNRTIGQDFAQEAPLLLPEEGGETCIAFPHEWTVMAWSRSGSAATRYPSGSSAAKVHVMQRSSEVVFFHGRTALKLTLIVDTWVSDHYGDPHAEVHSHHPAA
ncbi:hypothetical protein [Streptomyces sp. WAC04114]|uniref:hypothetical protein n=1 Tax=Streptomyces sp. WAC04114 TaxID=2867961 RepID=UPI001C8B0EFD|nr:hypothetical protein [Streptomyces sp. WAC04114]MBX9365341.1 hypothetical protein [Streptomyces sp. WAC04114]